MRMESPLQPDSKVRVRSQMLDRDVPQEDDIAAIVTTITGRTEIPDGGSTNEHMPNSAVNQVEQFIVREMVGTERTVVGMGRAPVDRRTDSANYNGAGRG